MMVSVVADMIILYPLVAADGRWSGHRKNSRSIIAAKDAAGFSMMAEPVPTHHDIYVGRARLLSTVALDDLRRLLGTFD